MNRFLKIITLFFLSFSNLNNAQETTLKKERYIPAKVWRVPEGNDYNDANSDYSYSRMIESDNIAMFWHKEYGNDPTINTDATKTFDPKIAIIACERFYNFYVDELKLVEKGNSISDKYKLLIYIFGGDENTAFGGGEEEVGILWTPAKRMHKPPYGALAHEIGHSFQYMSRADSKTGPGGPVMEMSAQYMLWQVYPEWMTFENYHLIDFLKGTHYAFLHPENMYHSPYVLEYWSEKHGKEFWGNLCRATQKGEDVVMTYKRMNSLTQDQFNDEMFYASRKFITWDLKRVDDVAKPYRNMHKAKLKKNEEGWFQIDSINCPQNYGYNGIKLNVPKAGTKVKVNFKGIVGANGYSAVKTDKAGWRYGFIASLKNGSRVYGDINKEDNETITFKTPKNTEYLWLVVMGAPTEHWSFPERRREKKSVEPEPDAQWPYQIKLSGASIVEL